ncbi:MAG: glycoside hydrolase family 9 protein, partial [Coprococcus sp.]
MLKKKMFHRVLAYILTICLVISGISIPAWTVGASSVSLDLKPDTGWKTLTAVSDEWSDSKKAEIRFSPSSEYPTLKAIADAGYDTLKIGYEVEYFTAEGSAGVMPFASYGTGWSNNDIWENLTGPGTYDVSLNLAAISKTDTNTLNFGIQIANITGDIKIRITSAILTGTGESGNAGGESGGASDGSSEIATDIEYNYAKLLQESLYFYDANMCGTDVKEKSELSWRDNCHAGDSKVMYDGNIVDLSGGYHDAGDHAKFGLPQAYAASTLGISYYQFKEAFTELGLEEHYKRIMDRFVDYFERCTILDTNGNVKAFCYQVGSGNTDHSYWGAPEKQADRNNQVWFTDSGVPATDIVSETAAALAIYYMNFKSSDSKNADKALEYSKKLFDYANSFENKSCVKIETDNATGNPFYNSTSWEDDYALAAAWLYKATGNDTYKSAYNSVYSSKNWVGWVLSWDDVSSIAMLYGPNESQRKYAADYVTKTINEKTQTGDNNYVRIESWGSARYNCALQLTGLIYDSKQYGSWANGQMKYLLGNNAGHHCFVIGYNQYSVKYPHHRAASGYEGSVAGTREQAHCLAGALVGGPSGTSLSYVDTADDYNQNEVALDYNAGLVGAAAGLYLYIKYNGTDEEKAVQKTVLRSEISNEMRNLSGSSSEEP